jgi:hypothetical protein
MSDGMGHFHGFCNLGFEVSHPSRNNPPRRTARVGHPMLKERVG